MAPVREFAISSVTGLPVTPSQACRGAGLGGFFFRVWIEMVPGFMDCQANRKEEWFPVVNENGDVTGMATRSQCHGGSFLLHPVAHLHVLDAQGRVYLQKRAMNKDIQPGKWDTSVGGHVDWGETPREGMLREAREELGVDATAAEYAYSYLYRSAREYELVTTYIIRYDGVITPDPGEIETGRFWTPEEIETGLDGASLTPNFRMEWAMLKRFLAPLTPRAKRDARLGESVVKALKARRFDAYYCDTPEAALKRVMSLIPATGEVAWGGSMTLEQLGVIRLARLTRKVIDRDRAATPAEKAELMRRSLLCDTYLMSANALTENGELFNIDANGNRVAALTYGPRQVIVVAGTNKIVKTLADAVARARYTAAPVNAARFDGERGCSRTGVCSDCKSPDSICCTLVCTRLCREPGRVKVVLVGGDWGY